MAEQLVPIPIPTEPNWNADRDIEFTTDRLDDDYLDLNEVLLRCFEGIRDLAAAMRSALEYCGANIEHHVNATVPELIDMVENQIRVRAPSQAYLERFTEHLAVCRFASNEFHRVLGIYAGNRELAWLAPLVDLGDWIVSATMSFEEGMVCEHEDFSRERTTHFAPLVAAPAAEPLSPAEMQEYQTLFAAWTQNGGGGAELLSPKQIARFGQLNDRISATQEVA